MLKVNKDGSLEVYERDAFSLMCLTDFEIEDVSSLKMIIVDEDNKKIIEKSATKNEKNIYFIFNSSDVNMTSGMYCYYIICEIDEQNRTTLTQNILKVKKGV